MNQLPAQGPAVPGLGIPLTRKCVKYFERRPFPPGVHGRGAARASDYQVRLLEKQRLRHQYNISEAQLRQGVRRRRTAAQGKTGENLVAAAGAPPRRARAAGRPGPHHLPGPPARRARPLHRRRPARSTGPPTGCSPGQVVEPSARRSRAEAAVPDRRRRRRTSTGPTAPYLSMELAELRTTLIREPLRTEVPVICDEQLVVEFYSR